jgi:hypothetical protein
MRSDPVASSVLAAASSRFLWSSGRRAQTFKEIEEELRSVYSIGYYPTNQAHDDIFRKIAVEPRAEGIAIRAKTGYYAR